MKKESEMDELFRHGLKKDFPYDQKLWAEVEAQLNVPSRGKGLWYTNMNTFILTLVLLTFAFIQTDTVKTNSVLHTESFNNTDEKKDLIALSDEREDKIVEVDQKQIGDTYQVSNNETIKSKSSNKNELKELSKVAVAEQLPNAHDDVIDMQEEEKNNQGPVEAENQIVEKMTSIIEEKGILFSSNSSFSKLLNKEKMSNEELQNLDLKLLIPLTYQINTQEYERALPYVKEDKLGKLQQKIKRKFYYAELTAIRSFDMDKEISDSDPDLKAFKELNEKSLHKESYGIDVFTDHRFLTFGLGIRLSSFVENVNYLVDVEKNEYVASFDTVYVLVDENFNNNGDATTLIREEIHTSYMPVTVQRKERLAVRNEFKRMQIPLSIGIEKSIGRWNAGVQAGIMMNYLFMQSGVYIDEELNKVEGLSTGDRFNKLTFSQSNEVKLGYKVNEFIVLGAKYAYEYDINSFTKNYDSKFQTQSLGLWIRWGIGTTYVPKRR